MIDTRKRLEELVDTSLKACLSWLEEDAEGGGRLVDPVDNKPIVSHYGDSHFGAALLILAEIRNSPELFSQGLDIIRTVVRDWHISEKYFDFHHDFNNFALCLAYERIEKVSNELSQEIKKLILTTCDSNHGTVNWLPMRAYVNRVRYEWTGKTQYLEASRSAIDKIRLATNDDGGIEDRLPVGASYNLQYNISSLAILQLIEKRWPDTELNSDKSLSFLIGCVLPDGDINYVGRGTNQIFAWGPWLYAISSTKKNNILEMALDFLDCRYRQSVYNNNILLNDFSGNDKTLWWDYHYCSVYHAHFLLWSILALKDYGAVSSSDIPSNSSGTGLEVIRGSVGGAVVFKGRKAYLAEAGPSLCALWIDKKSLIFKGGLGPWKGAFGQKYNYADCVFNNYFGVISESAKKNLPENTFIRKLRRFFPDERVAVTRPAFGEILVQSNNESLSIVFQTPRIEGYLNVPIFREMLGRVKFYFEIDGKEIESVLIAQSKNQYGWISIVRTRPTQGQKWKITISPQQDNT